jgi:hypothetical protein
MPSIRLTRSTPSVVETFHGIKLISSEGSNFGIVIRHNRDQKLPQRYTFDANLLDGLHLVIVTPPVNILQLKYLTKPLSFDRYCSHLAHLLHYDFTLKKILHVDLFIISQLYQNCFFRMIDCNETLKQTNKI